MKIADLLAADAVPFAFNPEEWHMLVYGDGQWPKSPIADVPVRPWWFFEDFVVKMGFAWSSSRPTFVERVRIARDAHAGKFAVFAEYSIGNNATFINANYEWDGTPFQHLRGAEVAWV